MKRIIPAAVVAVVLMCSAQTAQAQFTFGVHGAYDIDVEAFGVGAQFRTGLPVGGFSLVLNPSAEYYFTDDDEGVNTSLFRISGDLLYQIGEAYTQVFQPYVGAGLGVSIASVEIEDTEIDESETDFGLNLLAGATFGGPGITPFAQAGILIGDGSSVGIKAGILFGM
jgi:opacity protein-like surface antigen